MTTFYPCGCSATGGDDLPAECPLHEARSVQALKVTMPDGAIHHTRYWGNTFDERRAFVAAMWTKGALAMEVVAMTEAEYQAIPATPAAEALFR